MKWLRRAGCSWLLLLSLHGCFDDKGIVGMHLQFSLPRLDDAGAQFSSDQIILPAVVNLWASWCLPCRKEVPELFTLANGGSVRLYGLSYRDDPDDASRWLRFYGNPYRDVVFDQSGSELESLAQAGVPQTFVLDRRGLVRFHHIGPLTGELVQQRLVPLMEELQLEGMEP